MNESTVCNFKRNLQSQLRQGVEANSMRDLSSGKRGHLLVLPVELDTLTKELVRGLRSSGSPISSSIVIAAARGIVNHKNPSLLKEHGEQVELSKSWAKSFLDRLGYVKRKGTRTARKLPADFPEVKAAFLDRVTTTVEESKIPESMVVNCDQTGAKMVPVNHWTKAEEGSRQVDVVALDDKCC